MPLSDQILHLLRRDSNGLESRSIQYEYYWVIGLYGDMSNRVVSILRDFSPDIEVYSIDESFLRVECVAHLYSGLASMGQQIRERIRQWTGLPVCVGFGPSKTLAKLANHMAKKNPEFDGVCDLHAMSRIERRQWMSRIEVGEVWGVGRRINARLAPMGIQTVLDLRNASPKAIRAQFGVVMERTCEELRGVSCQELEEIAPPKQQIMSSRSFGKPVECVEELQEAVATYIGRAAEKLRQQGSVSGAVYVFVQTNPFKENESQYTAGLTVPLLNPSDDTRALIQVALKGLRAIYRTGYRYKKAGIMLTLLSDKATQQVTLFNETGGGRRSARLMETMDAVNREFGRNTLRSAATGIANPWAMRAGNRSQCYTTRWEELPAVM